MLAGSLNRENLTELFRTLSQKRKHGIVSVQSPDSSFEITFLSGRIAEVKEMGWLTSPAIYERLRISGRLTEDVLDGERLGQLDLLSLYTCLVEERHVSHDDFMMARSSLALDMLHSLHFLSTGVFQFDPRLLDFDDRLSLKLSPGQLLLDFVELETNEERYQELMSQFSGSSLGVLIGDDVGSLNTQEEEFLRAVGDGGELEEVMGRVLLSENDFRSVLLSLHDRGAIFVYPLSPIQSSGSSEDRGSENATDDGDWQGPDSVDASSAVVGEEEGEAIDAERDAGGTRRLRLPFGSPSVLNPPGSRSLVLGIHQLMVMLVALGVIAGVGFLLPSRVQLFVNGVEELMRFLT